MCIRDSLDLGEDFKQNYIKINKEIAQQQKKIERIRREIEKVNEKIREFLEKRKLAEEVARIKSEKRKEWYEKYHWIITSENLLAIGGRNEDQNESIVRKYLGERDLFFHADIHGGSVFILKNGVYAGERSIREVAHLAACYSSAWRSGFGSVDVFYVGSDQVSKSPPSGEYLPKGSFMIYGEKKWVRGVELRLGIGIEIVNNKYPRIIVGPPDYISNKTSIYAILVPGDQDIASVAEEIIEKWLEKHSEYEVYIRSLEKEEIIPRIPGKSRILYIN